MEQALGTLMVQVVLPIVAAIVSVLLALAVRKLGKWLDIKALREAESNLQDIAERVVLSLENEARQWARDQGKEMSDSDWWSRAIKYMGDNAPDLSSEQVVEYVENALEWTGIAEKHEQKKKKGDD